MKSQLEGTRSASWQGDGHVADQISDTGTLSHQLLAESFESGQGRLARLEACGLGRMVWTVLLQLLLLYILILVGFSTVGKGITGLGQKD